MKDKTRELLEKLGLAAEKSKTRRFHQLYDKVYRKDVLMEAWLNVKANKGCPGVDGVRIKDIVRDGEEEYVDRLHELLLDTHNYHPSKIKRVFIPKADGGKRPLGIPTLRDRVVQTATKIVLEPIFETDFLDCSYGFRPSRSAHEATEEIRLAINEGYRFVIDADIKGYFDNINHDKLLEFVNKRISDKKVLKLIRKWLKAGVVGELDRNEIGILQGGVISPLLANIYLHEFDLFWNMQTGGRGKLIRYADDFVILCKSEKDAKIAMKLVKAKLRDLGLALNERKTRIVGMNGGREGFDFLGFHFRQKWSKKYRKRYTLYYPKKASVRKLKQRTKLLTGKRGMLRLSVVDMVRCLNPVLRGWMNYFKVGNSAKVFAEIDEYVHYRMALWWKKKHGKRPGGKCQCLLSWGELKMFGLVSMSGNVLYLSNFM